MNDEDQKIRVLHLIEHLKVGGAERAVVDLVKTLDSSRIQSTVCVYRSIGAFGEELQRSGHPIVFIRKEIFTIRFPKFLRVPLVFLESILFVIRLVHLIQTNKIQIVHSHLFSANLWGRLAVTVARSSRIIVTEHNTSNLRKSLKRSIVNRLLAPLSHRTVAVSKPVAESIIKARWTTKDRLITIPNGINLSRFDCTSNRENGILPGTRPRIAIIAYLWPVKRHDLLFQAIKICKDRTPNITCCVVGDGTERAHLEQLSQDLHLTNTVYFLGERHDVNRLLQDIDIVVSTSDNEGLPINLMEAMAAGVPVVATDVGGTGEIVKPGETGILVKQGNVQSICDGLCKLIDNPALAKKIGRNGLTMIREFYSMESIARKWKEVYFQTI